ncbi:glycosyltransferase [Halonotius terrestris]|uniref:Glycosyltransferase n=1 Tax=Halonotius terrestris TaxID=2487750 RepID=A0A8J8PDH5_9EURY|nr:glycosyltransferase [Halonotius terrestris]TQQ83376.1 glycosyltransferase [Halonotius terrestris]
MSEKIAIAHDHFPQIGGAERVALKLANIFDATIYTSYTDENVTVDDVPVYTLFNGSILSRLIKRRGRIGTLVQKFYYQLGWSQATELAEYDIVIQSGSAPMWYVPPDDQVIVRYVHTPPRSVYSKFQDNGKSLPVSLFTLYLRAMRTHTVPYAERYVANSELVARRIRKYWGVPTDAITVVYPPVDVTGYKPSAGKEYYVAVSRLVDHKRFKPIIKAFANLPSKELRIVGDGPERDTLEQQAKEHENIRFEGYVSERKKQSLLSNAKASMYNALNEDFGIVPIESWAAGTPVIGVSDGFTQYQIQDGKTGILFARAKTPELTAANIQDAVRRFESEGIESTPADLHQQAKKFSSERFTKRMQQVVAEVKDEAAIKPAFLQN